ncbi:MAG TPA: primosomal protein N' [Longilinea sp.]|nr:primosomal protein N' [Longilinea sp.]
MPEYIQVAVNVPLMTGIFDYHLPTELEGQVKPGCLVVVPFNRQSVHGIVLRQVAEPQVQETRPVTALLDPQPALTPAQLALAQWMSDTFLAPLASCLDVMLPAGLIQLADTRYILNDEPKPAAALSPLQQRIVKLLQERGPLRGRQIDTALPRQAWKPAALALVKKGNLLTRAVLPPPSVHSKTVRTAQLAVPPGEAEDKLQDKKHSSAVLQRRIAVVHFLQQESVPVSVPWVYADSGCDLQDLKAMAEDGILILGETEVWRDPLANLEWVPSEPPPLTVDQANALEKVNQGIRESAAGQSPLPYLLHGVTGSGKTEIYLQAVDETLRLGRQAIILVPEIALTPQTVRRFLSRFPGQVGLVHSKLSPGERYDTWRRARDGRLPVIIGPRSALFTPLPDTGLIVVDECHDDSYYQDDFPPAYDAVATAIAYGRLSHAVVVLGTATPSVRMVYQAEKEGWTRLELPVRILAHTRAVKEKMASLNRPVPSLQADGVTASLPLPPVHVVDMREELKQGNRSIFSTALQTSLGQVLDAGQQAILFLNRRGSATYVFCRECGYSLRCPHCDLPLTYHAGESILLCHSCGYRRSMPSKCPNCGSTAIRQFGLGTEKVEEEVKALFPNAETLRWDAETTRQKGAHEIIMAHFANQHANVLIGTQMLAKGLDLPLVTLVGVVLADVGLNLPDYHAPERTFQLLTQVAGRAGRSPLGGQVILQTFNPDHYAIRAAAAHDFAGFYKQELDYRRKLRYPPFTRLVKLEYHALKADQAERAARTMAQQLQHWIEDGSHAATELIGPVPSFYARVNGYYRWQIILRGPDPASILAGKPLGDWRVAVDPVSLL